MLPLPPGCEPRCPACPHRQWTAADSLAQKESFLRSKLSDWLDSLESVRSVDEPRRLGYRRKVKLGARWMNYHWQFGLEPRDDFIGIPTCPVHAPVVNAAAAVLAEALPPPEEFPLRYYVQNGALVTLVIKSQKLPRTDWLTPEFIATLSETGVRGLYVNLHPATGGILFSKSGWRCLWGESQVQDELGLWHGPGAFQQQLPELYAQSLDEAGAFLAANEGDWIVDFYSGIGSSLQRWSRHTSNVTGIEADGPALESARRNAPKAGLLRGLCAQRLPQVDRDLTEMPAHQRGLAYLNPPRTGAESEVLDWLARRMRPERIAYLSCSAGTLARDLRILTAEGYRVTKLIPFDFFPQTVHVETLALIEQEQA